MLVAPVVEGSRYLIANTTEQLQRGLNPHSFTPIWVESMKFLLQRFHLPVAGALLIIEAILIGYFSSRLLGGHPKSGQ